ncbi:MAG: hypothetical protein HQM10_25080 [Candidatus Riflebacteria bacterium]|nr:hypothetical protein [Candidatus Riflebacteria bacterium]
MKCNKAYNWFENEINSDQDNSFSEIQEHADKCIECKNFLKNLNSIEREISTWKLSETEFTNTKSKFFAGLKKSDIEATPEKHLISGKVLLLLTAVTFSTIALFTEYHKTPISQNTSENTSETAPQISVTGKQAVLFKKNGIRIPLLNEPVQVKESSYFLEFSDGATLDFQKAGKVELSGKGTILLSSDGFSTSDGNFSVNFQSTKTDLKIYLPTVILKSNNAGINLKLTSGNGYAEISKGKAELLSLSTESVISAFETGEKIVISSGTSTKTSEIPDGVRIPKTHESSSSVQEEKNNTIQNKKHPPKKTGEIVNDSLFDQSEK